MSPKPGARPRLTPNPCLQSPNPDKMRTMNLLLSMAILVPAAMPARAQIAMPPSDRTHFKDTSSLKPPPGRKIAIIEFDDLECPYCAFAAPKIHAAMQQDGIPLIHHDFLIPGHHWSPQAAIEARYLEDEVSSQLADQFRTDVFANQSRISNREDLARFTARWFQSHHEQQPSKFDPSGVLAKEVQADCTYALRIGVAHTPTIVVVTAKEWIEVTSPDRLYAAIDRAESDAGLPGPHH